MRAIVVYDTWYGDTRRVAEEIARGLAEALHVDPAVLEVGHTSVAVARSADLLVVGTPNHFGGPTRGIRQFVRDVTAAGPVPGAIAVFDTCFAGESGKVAEKLGRMIAGPAARDSPAPPALSLLVDGTRGPLHAGELARARAWGLKLGRVAERRSGEVAASRPEGPGIATVYPA